MRGMEVDWLFAVECSSHFDFPRKVMFHVGEANIPLMFRSWERPGLPR